MARPVRTCVGCRGRKPAEELIRFVSSPSGGVGVGRLLPGRGYYVCPSAECIARLEKRLRGRFDEKRRRCALETLFAELEKEKG